jgi:hypothetical protein
MKFKQNDPPLNSKFFRQDKSITGGFRHISAPGIATPQFAGGAPSITVFPPVRQQNYLKKIDILFYPEKGRFPMIVAGFDMWGKDGFFYPIFR